MRIMINGTAAIMMDQYPPWGILYMFETRKTTSTAVINVATAAFIYLCLRYNIHVIIMPVRVMVPVTARPYAAARCAVSLNSTMMKMKEKSRNQLTDGMYICDLISRDV